MMLPYVVGLCPTYRRPALLENTIACWNRQDYPVGRRELVICDDAQEIEACFDHGWWLYRTPRFNSICDKYNSMARDAAPVNADIFFVIEDDEIYMPWHVSSHVNAYLRDPAGLAQPRWAQSETVFSLYTGALQQEGSDGRFHAALSFNRAMFDAVGGWPNTRQANFDQQLISNMKGIAPPLRPVDINGKPDLPGYVFRWASTNAYHGQVYMDAPDNTTWWDVVPGITTPQPRKGLTPAPDSETFAIIEQATALRKALLQDSPCLPETTGTT